MGLYYNKVLTKFICTYIYVLLQKNYGVKKGAAK